MSSPQQAIPTPPLRNPISTTPLAAATSSSSIFASAFEQMQYNDLSPMNTAVLVLASSDQQGTLYVDQSVDGVNVSRSISFTLVSDPGPQGGYSGYLEEMLALPYVRYRFVNTSPSAQKRFLLWRRFINVH